MQVWQILVALGAEVRDNPFGKRPYPYIPQVRAERARRGW
jgi:hypothetical protein